jgi:hypothetical protein
MFGMDAVVLPLSSQKISLIAEYSRGRETASSGKSAGMPCAKSGFHSLPIAGGRLSLGETKKGQETLSFAEVNPPPLPWRARKLEENQ